MMTALQNNCERLESSLREKIAAVPPTICTAMNSRGCCSMTAQMMIIVAWAMKAVRESMNTRMKIGTIEGRI